MSVQWMVVRFRQMKIGLHGLEVAGEWQESEAMYGRDRCEKWIRKSGYDDTALWECEIELFASMENPVPKWARWTDVKIVESTHPDHPENEAFIERERLKAEGKKVDGEKKLKDKLEKQRAKYGGRTYQEYAAEELQLRIARDRLREEGKLIDRWSPEGKS